MNENNIILQKQCKEMLSLEEKHDQKSESFVSQENETQQQSTSSDVVIGSDAVDITPGGDGGVMKQVLIEGEGDTPGYGDRVFIHYTGWLTNGEVFDTSRKQNEKFEFSLGRGQVIKCWDLGVSTMKKGERALFICHPQYAYGHYGHSPTIPPAAILFFDIELLDCKLEDLSPRKDNGILRKIIEKGEGSSSPNESALVKVHLIGYHVNNIFEERDLTFSLGEGEIHNVVDGVEIALFKFKKGEKSLIKLKAKYGFGNIGNEEFGIPPDSDLEYEVKLEYFEKAKEVWEMDSDEKLLQSEIARTKGTQYFTTGRHKLAAKQYKKIVNYLQNEPGLSTEEFQKRKPLLVAGLLNVAVCHLKLENYLEAIKSCDKALELEPESLKGLYRRGQARLAINDFDLARNDFQTVLKIDNSNKAAKNQLIISINKLKQQHEKERRTYCNMFSKFAQQDEEEIRKLQRQFQVETGVWQESELQELCPKLVDDCIVKIIHEKLECDEKQE